MAGQFYGRTGVDFRNTIPEGVEKLKAVLRKRIEQAVLEAGNVVAERAYDLANVSAGAAGHAADGSHMRDNIAVHIVKGATTVEARIGIDMSIVPYAHHQEFGPRGKPFLRPAMDESRSEVHDIMQGALDGTVAEDSSSFVRFNRGKRPEGSEE